MDRRNAMNVNYVSKIMLIQNIWFENNKDTSYILVLYVFVNLFVSDYGQISDIQIDYIRQWHPNKLDYRRSRHACRLKRKLVVGATYLIFDKFKYKLLPINLMRNIISIIIIVRSFFSIVFFLIIYR